MAVKTSWAAGDVLLAADLTDTFAAKSDYAMPKNAQTGTTYTFVLADAQKLVTASNAASSTYTVPPQSSVTWAADTILRVTNLGAGTVTFAGGAGVTVTNTAATLAQYASANLIRTGSDAWTVVPFSGGSAAAVVTSTTGSPTTGSYTLSGVAYTVRKWTGAGSIVIGTAGWVDLVVVGGGMAGYSNAGDQRGGAGGGCRYGRFWLPAGTHSIAVGAKAAWSVTAGISSIGTVLVGRGGMAPTEGTGGSGTLGSAGYGGGGSEGPGTSGGVAGAGYVSTIGDGSTSVTYGAGGAASGGAAAAANTGSGGGNGALGADGVVIVRTW